MTIGQRIADIKCQATGCGEARHLSSKTKEYLAYCTNRQFSAIQLSKTHSLTFPDVTCPVRQCTALKIDRSPFCNEHTCHGRDCSKATTVQPYCEDREFSGTDSHLFNISDDHRPLC